MKYVAHENDDIAVSALNLLQDLGLPKSDTLILTGADPLAPSGATVIFTSPTGDFPGKYLRIGTSVEALEVRKIHVPAFARSGARLVALRVRTENAEQVQKGRRAALQHLSGLHPPKKKRNTLARWRSARNLRARDNGFFA